MSDNRYLEDKTLEQGYYEEGIINVKNMAIATALVGGTAVAYRKGIFKQGIKKVLEDTSKSKPKLTEIFNDARKWLKSDEGVPENSIFRMGVKGIFKNVYSDGLDGAKEVINSTKEDVDIFLNRYQKTLERLVSETSEYSVRNSTHNTDILKGIKDIDQAVGAYSDDMMIGKNTLKSKGNDELIKKFFQSSEEASKSIKRTGYRKVELDDLFDIVINKNGKVELVEKTKFTFSTNDKLENKTAKRRLEELLNSTVINEDGIAIKQSNGNPLRMHDKFKDKFKHISLDESLLIDEAGKIIDFRSQKRSGQEFVRNLATEWQIPVVGFNPFRMVGLDKLGKEKAFMGSISEDTVAPFLTGVRGNSADNTIANLKNKVKVLNGVKENVTIINGDVYRMSDDKIGITKLDYKKKKELVYIPKSLDKGTYALTPTENALRKMGGLSTKSFEDYTKDDGFKYYKQKISKFFDIGYQESNISKGRFDSLDDYSNTDSYIEKIISKVSPKPYKDAKVSRTFSNISTPGYEGGHRSSFFVVNKNTTLKDVKTNKFNKEVIKDYFYQFVADFDKDFENVNRNTGKLFFMLERMNQSISTVGLGLSVDSTKSSWDTAKNLFLKRFLPVYGAYQGYQFINMIGEDDTENGTKPSTLHQRLMSAVSKTDVGLHAITEQIGLPKLIENLSQLTPGSDMIEELPGIKMLNLQDTSDERVEYWENGYDPVRKGRYWELNETPFVGGKIQYYKPNALRSAMADAKFSDSLYGSRKEYFSQMLNHNYYDKKNYKDRPYLLTSSPFENVPLVGPLLSSTVGRVISPPKKMHQNYWNLDENRPKDSSEIKMMSQGNISYIESLNQRTAYNSSVSKNTTLKDRLTIFNVFGINNGVSNSTDSTVNNSGESAFNGSQVQGENEIFTAYKTSGGSLSYINFSDNPISGMYKINKRGYTKGQVNGVDDRASLINSYMIDDSIISYVDGEDVKSPYDLDVALKNQYMDSTNVAGIYGFVLSSATGNPGAGETVIETPSYSRSFNKTFWDREVGGAGGDISEIFRRFLQKRRNDVNYYNPVRNTQADWMPGEGSFINFQTGDPYCVSPNTLIETNNGYKMAKNVTSKDMIITHKSRYHDIKYIINRPILEDEEVFKINIFGLSDNVSPIYSENHPIYIKKMFKCGFGSSCLCRPSVRNFNGFCDNHNCTNKWDNTPIEFVKAKDCKVGDAVVYPIPVIEKEITEITYSYKYNFAPRSKTEIVTGKLNLTKDLSWLLGLYIAEGSTAKKFGKPMRLIFSLNSNELDIIDKIIEEILKIDNCKIVTNTRKNSTDVIIYSAKLARIFDNIMPGNLYKKRIPTEIFMSSTDVKLNFILGFMLGDGSVQQNSLIGSSANRDLMLDFHKLCLNTGIPCKYMERATRNSYELSIHAFNLRNFNIENLLYKKDCLNMNFTRQPSLKTWTDGIFIYSLIKSIEKDYDTDEVIGFEVDDDDTFCTISMATHNTKIPNGEERIAGEGYERLHGIDMDKLLRLQIGSSSVGKSKDEIIKHFLHQDEITDKDSLDIVNTGTKEHERIEKELLKSGVAIDSEVEIKDEVNGVVGTYDARIIDPTSKSGEAIVDIKTINEKGFREIQKTNVPKDVNQRQVNWYLHHTNKDNKGYIMYVNRDNPEETHTIGFKYNEKMYKSTMATLEEARNEVRTALQNGQISRGDLYKPIDKYRILADVAPYSKEFNEMKQMMSSMQLSKEEEEELKQIKARTDEVKKQSRFYNYRFKNSETLIGDVKIKRQVDDDTYSIKGYDSPIKLAGVKINKSHPKYKEAMEFLNENLSEGSTVKMRVAKDPSQRNKNDQFKSFNAVVYNNGKNINRELIKRGYAEENKEDFSPAGVYARFNGLERNFGKAWENIAHFDSLVNTKLLQVRTASEDYERKQVYGKPFKKWTDPVGDFLLPSIWKNVNKNVVWGVASGAVTGYMFGGFKSKYGKLIGTLTGAATIGVGKLYKTGYEATTGEKWIPKEKRKSRELNDYLDKIEFIKNRRLFEIYSEKALNEDEIDVKDILSSNKLIGKSKASKKRRIQNVKKDAKLSGKFDYKEFEKAGVKIDAKDKLPNFLRVLFDKKSRDELKEGIDTDNISKIIDVFKNSKKNKEKSILSTTNNQINEILNNRKSFALSENAIKAIEYYNASESTMYGYDPGEPITNIMSAMPKEDREYFKSFLEAPKHERKKIMQIAPKYMKRALQNAYGMKVDDKEDLNEYFSEHYLPGADWDGWQENFNLNAMKVKLVQSQNLELASFNLWEDDKKEADLYGKVAIPNMDYKTKNPEVIKRKLTKILGQSGYEDIDIDIMFSKNKNTINMDLYEDRKEKYENKLKERLGIQNG